MASILERNKKVKAPKKTREEYAEDALYREVWEEVNNEKTMRFVKKYYRQILVAATAIVVVVAAIQIGVAMHNRAKVARAINYEMAVANLDAAALEQIGKNAGGATADLALFQSYLIDGDANKLEFLANNGHSRDFRDLARIHVVRRRGDEMSASDVEKYLSDLDTKSSPYYYSACLIIAQKYLADGDRASADKWLNKIIGDKDAPAVIAADAEALK